MLAHMLANWRTTAAGLTMIVTSTIHLIFQLIEHVANESAWTVAFLAVIGGLGLMFAGDASQSVKLDKPLVPDEPKQP